jgi:hypothetical protein
MGKNEIRIKYLTIGSFEFNTVMQKLVRTQTNNKAATHIKQVSKRVDAGRKKIHEEYMTEIVPKYAKKNEDGTIDRTGGNEGDLNFFTPKDELMQEFLKAQEEFGKRELVIDWRPLTPSCLEDVSISAHELDAIGEVYTEEEGPGVPSLHSVN